MNELNIKKVSTHDVFPILADILRYGKKVKFTVSGNSMFPWIISNRDQVIVKRVENNNLKLGDIILFKNNSGEYILHRIYKKDEYGYYTIGDGCIYDDGVVNIDNIVAVVDSIYRKKKRIDCNSYKWRIIFFVWRKLLPIRRSLINKINKINKYRCLIVSLVQKSMWGAR